VARLRAGPESPVGRSAGCRRLGRAEQRDECVARRLALASRSKSCGVRNGTWWAAPACSRS